MVDKPTFLSPEPMPAYTRRAEPSSASRTNEAGMRTPEDGDFSASTYSNYLFGRAGQNDKPLWSDTTKGRIAIRLFSRGIFGSMAFAWGTQYAEKALQRYEPETWRLAGESIGEAIWRNPLQAGAKLIDSTVGRAIQKGARLIAPTAEQADLWAYESTRFRSKGYFHGSDPKGLCHVGERTGRSLGGEMMNVTFNFAMASIADASVRNLAQGLDPNNKKTWLVDENGNPATHGKFLPGAWAKSVAGASWRIITKNQGEDWAAALPYVYQMKWQRQWIANHAPNFKLSADNGWNGASMIVDREGNVKGSLEKAGAVDLHSRFVGYNWYTLMYRETYDMIGYKLGQWQQNHFQVNLPKLGNPVTAAVEGLGSTGRYMLKSFIKANIYMQPAMFFFWPMRVAQSKRDAGIIVDDAPLRTNAIVTKQSMDTDLQGLGATRGWHSLDEAREKLIPPMHEAYHKWDAETKTFKPEYEFRYQSKGKKSRIGENHPMFAGNHNLAGSEIHRATSPFDSSLQKTTFSKVLNPLGKLSCNTGSALNHVFNWHGSSASEKFLRNAGDAFWAYTPYMIAKQEFALRVDERPSGHELGDEDKAIYRLIDNVFTFNLKGAGQALSDVVYHAVRTKEHLSGREGGADVIAPIASTQPTSVVQTASIQQSPMLPHDPTHLSTVERDAEKGESQSWSARAVNGSLQPLSPSLH